MQQRKGRDSPRTAEVAAVSVAGKDANGIRRRLRDVMQEASQASGQGLYIVYTLL